jgi:hypothetical protein
MDLGIQNYILPLIWFVSQIHGQSSDKKTRGLTNHDGASTRLNFFAF